MTPNTHPTIAHTRSVKKLIDLLNHLTVEFIAGGYEEAIEELVEEGRSREEAIRELDGLDEEEAVEVFKPDRLREVAWALRNQSPETYACFKNLSSVKWCIDILNKQCVDTGLGDFFVRLMLLKSLKSDHVSASLAGALPPPFSLMTEYLVMRDLLIGDDAAWTNLVKEIIAAYEAHRLSWRRCLQAHLETLVQGWGLWPEEDTERWQQALKDDDVDAILYGSPRNADRTERPYPLNVPKVRKYGVQVMTALRDATQPLIQSVLAERAEIGLTTLKSILPHLERAEWCQSVGERSGYEIRSAGLAFLSTHSGQSEDAH